MTLNALLAPVKNPRQPKVPPVTQIFSSSTVADDVVHRM
jgi:hypothetical protein